MKMLRPTFRVSAAFALLCASCSQSGLDAPPGSVAPGATSGGSGGASVVPPLTGSGGEVGSSGGATQGTGGSGPLGPPTMVPDGPSHVSVSGRQLILEERWQDGTLLPPVAFDMRGISYHPVPKGSDNDTSGAPFRLAADQDIPLLEELGVNTLKLYDPPERNADGWALMDRYYLAGLKVAMTVLPARDSDFAATVEFFKDHPAVLLWIVGNEWNFNQLYSDNNLSQSIARIEQVTQAIHATDPHHPVASSFGEMPSSEILAQVPSPDVWAVNLYPGLNFVDRFDIYKTRTTKPLFVGEYGADAYNAQTQSEDQAGQSEALSILTNQIRSQLSSKDPNAALVGGCPYGFADEWWKSGNPSVQDNAGFDLGGVHPDGHATEEWWGIVSIERDKRAAYHALRDIYLAQ